ncbi:MAG: hypothetical protein PHU25_17370 [Deltaproteobacteria bacterium]|nr:hypothetical protein [Deltaproteobacteria bacterium]
MKTRMDRVTLLALCLAVGWAMSGCGSDGGGDDGSDGGTDSGTDAGADSGADTDSDTDSDTDTDGDTDADSDTDSDTDTDGDTDTEDAAADGGDAAVDAGPDAGDSGSDGGLPGDVFFDVDDHTLAVFELDGDTLDSSGNGRDATFLGGTFEDTPLGHRLRLTGADPQGFDWSAYASLLVHPYTIEMILTPDSVSDYQKLFGVDDAADDGWYIYNGGFVAYPETEITNPGIFDGAGLYFALISTDASNIDVYLQGVYLGSTAASFTAPPTSAIFFRDDTNTARGEQLAGLVDAVRISNVARTPAELAVVAARL